MGAFIEVKRQIALSATQAQHEAAHRIEGFLIDGDLFHNVVPQEMQPRPRGALTERFLNCQGIES